MDPISLAAGAVALLSPYLARASAEFAGAAGKAAWGLAGRLFDRLKNAVADKPVEHSALENLSREPEKAAPAAQAALQTLFATDTSLAEEVAGLLAEVKRLGPQVLVTQRIKEAEDIVGVKA